MPWKLFSLCRNSTLLRPLRRRYSDSLGVWWSGDLIQAGGEIFRTRSDRPWVPPSLLHIGYRIFPGAKTAGAWRWPRTPSSAEVKERAEVYLYSPSGPSWPVVGRTLPLPLRLLRNIWTLPHCWLFTRSGYMVLCNNLWTCRHVTVHLNVSDSLYSHSSTRDFPQWIFAGEFQAVCTHQCLSLYNKSHRLRLFRSFQLLIR